MDPEEFLRVIAGEIVSNKDAIKIEKKSDEMGVLLTLSVDTSDTGKMIGIEGKTANAIRTILRTAGMRNNARVSLKIVDPIRDSSISS